MSDADRNEARERIDDDRQPGIRYAVVVDVDGRDHLAESSLGDGERAPEGIQAWQVEHFYETTGTPRGSDSTSRGHGRGAVDRRRRRSEQSIGRPPSRRGSPEFSPALDVPTAAR